MGRGRTKGKKNQDDLGSGEEEKIPAQKRRGRPLKTLKDEIDEDEAQKLEDEDSQDTSGVLDKSKNGKKQKKNAQMKDKADPAKEEDENGKVTSSNTEESKKLNGFRHSRSRRKNTPRRAAEAVVECN